MAVEINADGDVTENGDDPFSSDNLAQRNLVVLKSDNPGGPLTHQVQHSFEAFTGDRRKFFRRDPQREFPLTHLPAGVPDQPVGATFDPAFITADQFEEKVAETALLRTFKIGMHHGNLGTTGTEPSSGAIKEAESELRQRFPLVFDSARWVSRGDLFDELLIKWNGLPKNSTARLYLPGINCEHVINLRNLRHAPSDVRISSSHTLDLDVGDVTYIPIPADQNTRVPAVITIDLPEGIRSGQRWTVDVIQLRGEERRSTGAFQIEVEVSKAELIAGDELETLTLMHERLSLLPEQYPWRPILEERVRYHRERGRALADAAGVEWVDPTVWFDPEDKDRKTPKPFRGRRVRVVLEKIKILDDKDPLLKGRGEMLFTTQVHSSNNGGQLTRYRFPERGVFKVSAQDEVPIHCTIFEGYVEDDLKVEISGTELDTFNPDDVLGKYSRLFCGDPDTWYGAYTPCDESPIEPEHLGSWQIWYRIERP